MREILKSKPTVILAVLSVLLFIAVIGSYSATARIQKMRDSEMAKRLDIEERLSKVVQENSILAERLKTKEKELEEEKTAHQAEKKALLQERLINQNLKEELVKVTKFKAALEEDLKSALASGKGKASAK
ncbi:MAG: hypothetical protein NC923_05315 [Candidatus Omnitrophica bacterium]|nr:hypothetical protein [Candidatus Omnitrophota bacterium]